MARHWEGSGWTVETSKAPILSSNEIDAATERLGIPVPEMIFGNNRVEIRHLASGLQISFDCLNALDLVDKTGQRGKLVQVAYSGEWMDSRRETAKGRDDIQGIVRPFDWTYTTDYRGDTAKGDWTLDDGVLIPKEVLSQPDPILFYDEVCLFEDELGDNGIVNLTAKIRVMPKRLLLLARLFLRVDDVLFRVRDTRVYVEFSAGVVIREYQEREASYADVRAKVPVGAHDFGMFLRNIDWVAQQVPATKVIKEIIEVPVENP